MPGNSPPGGLRRCGIGRPSRDWSLSIVATRVSYCPSLGRTRNWLDPALPLPDDATIIGVLG